MEQSTRLQREELAPSRPLPLRCDADAFVPPFLGSVSCAPLSCDGSLIEAAPSVLPSSICVAPEEASTCGYEAWEPAPLDEAALSSAPAPCERERAQAPLRPEVLEGYFPLVRKLVRQMSRHLPPNVQRDDLVGAGLLGLIDSVRKNGGSDGETFAGYAKLRIRGAIVDELRAQDWLSRRAREAVEADAAAGRIAGTTVFVSLSEITPAEESVHLSGHNDPIEALMERSTRRALVGAIAQLPERERRVVGMYYFEGAKLKEIGAALGVSEPRVSQLHSRALGMLRDLLTDA